VAIHAYYSQDPSGDDRQTVLVDLLTDLYHYADAHSDVDFTAAVQTALAHYIEEAGAGDYVD
jgi:hypothetical protein